MPPTVKELSAIEVKRLKYEGKGQNTLRPVGGVSGLNLQITPSGARSWILRVRVGAKRPEIGLGPYPEVSLTGAKDKARIEKEKIRNGTDPMAARRTARATLIAEQRRGLSFANAVTRYLDAKLEEHSNEKHRKQWRATLQQYALPEIGEMMVQDISVQDMLRLLNQPLTNTGETFWKDRTETASRVRQRIEKVLSWATVSGYRTGDNPARWAGNLKELLPETSKVAKKTNQPALQISEAPRWFKELRKREGMGSRALELAALCASRSQEVRGACWDEIDLDAGIWIIPAERMKMDKEHRIPLSREAIALLRQLPRFTAEPLVFPSVKGGEISDMTLSATMKRIHEADISAGGAGFIDRVNKRPAVPHGLRSTFRDWIAEATHFAGDMAEVALAHKISNAAEASYRRGDMLEKRREMMQAWADYLTNRDF